MGLNSLLNLVFALLFGWLALWVMLNKIKSPEPLAWIVAVIVAIIVFFLNLAGLFSN